jgi:hypothetical protein
MLLDNTVILPVLHYIIDGVPIQQSYFLEQFVGKTKIHMY